MHNIDLQLTIDDLKREFEIYKTKKQNVYGNFVSPVGGDYMNIFDVESKQDAIFSSLLLQYNNGSLEFNDYYVKETYINNRKRTLYIPSISKAVFQKALIRKLNDPILKYPICSLMSKKYSSQNIVCEMSESLSNNKWFVHLDIKSCMESIDRYKLKNIVLQHFTNNVGALFLKYIDNVSDYLCEECGLFTGDPFSSALQNLYLTSYDSYILNCICQLPVLYYRYVDDIFFISNDISIINKMEFLSISFFNDTLGMELKLKKRYDIEETPYIDFYYFRFNRYGVQLRKKLISWYHQQLNEIIDCSDSLIDAIRLVNKYILKERNDYVKFNPDSMLSFFIRTAPPSQRVQMDKWIARKLRNKFYKTCECSEMNTLINRNLLKISHFGHT